MQPIQRLHLSGHPDGNKLAGSLEQNGHDKQPIQRWQSSLHPDAKKLIEKLERKERARITPSFLHARRVFFHSTGVMPLGGRHPLPALSTAGIGPIMPLGGRQALPALSTPGMGPSLGGTFSLLPGPSNPTLTFTVISTSSSNDQSQSDDDASRQKWAGWRAVALAASREGIRQWAANAFCRGTIMAVMATIRPGDLRSPVCFEETIRAALSDAGAPGPVATAFAGVVWVAWKSWFSGYTVAWPGFPAFAAFPLAAAPPMPCPAFSMALGVSSGTLALTSGNLGSALRGKLGNALGEAGAGEAADGLARDLALFFTTWLASRTLGPFLGWGPIPTFAPPYVPVGPVVGGTVAGDNVISGPDF
jgi:hypothetical protein